MSNSSECKKPKGVNENVVAKISHSDYIDVLLNKKMFKTFNEQNSKYRRGTKS